MMKLTSSAFQHEGNIPSRYTCDGEGISPPLTISGVPQMAKSLVLIMDDPDVPKNIRSDGIWDHWVVFNIPPNTTEIPEGQEPKGTPGVGTNNKTGYYGPCPPNGTHHYYFNLYALDTELSLPANSTKKEVLKALQEHVLAKTILLGYYKREE